jgi:hypothetical protein
MYLGGHGYECRLGHFVSRLGRVYLATIGPALGAFFTCVYAKYVWHRIPYAG